MSDARSYSQLSTYGQCPRQFELEKIRKVPRRPGHWFPAGTAVHASIEAYLRETVQCASDAAVTVESRSVPTGTGTANPSTNTPAPTGVNPTLGETTTQSPLDVEAIFQDELATAYADELRHTTFPEDEWFVAGRGKGKDRLYWMMNGSALAQNFIDWHKANPQFHIWITPKGEPAIELPLEVNFGSVKVRMVIDSIFEVGDVKTGNGALVVVDFKSGSTKPKNERQLGTYACGVEIEYGIRPRYGTYFMCQGVGKDPEKLVYFQPVTEMAGPQYSYEYLTKEYEALDRAIENEVFMAVPGDNCRMCGVSYACTEMNPEQAKSLDPHYPWK